MGYGLEVEMIRLARELDLLTAPTSSRRTRPWRWPRPARTCSCPHMGLTTGGAIGAETREDARRVRRARSRRCATRRSASTRTIIVLCHGGPIAEPDDAAYVLERTEGVVGFFGASTHGAAADRGRDDGEHEAVQGDPGGRGHRWQERSSRHRRSTGRSTTGGLRPACSGPRARARRHRHDRGDVPAGRSATTSTSIPARTR